MDKPGRGSQGEESSVREELAQVAASLRAYLEWQQDTGVVGIPRRPRADASTNANANANANENASASANARAEAAPDTHAPSEAYEPSSAFPNEGVDERAEKRATVANPAFAAPPVPPAVPAPARAPAAAAAPPVASPVAARAPAAPPRPLATVEAEAKGCTRCGLAASRTHVVFSRGSADAKICLVGEAPGEDEDATGAPFVGRAGQLLDKMIAAMGLDPAKDVYVCNIIKCRPPANRKPEPVEIETCIPYLHEQLAAIEPKVIIALGNTAVAALLGTKLGITKVRGQWKLYRGKIPVMPTYHPSYLLRPSAQQVEAKKQAWEDLQAVMKELGLKPPPRKG